MDETRQPLTWPGLALVAVVIGAILAAGATKMNGGIFGGEPTLANIEIVPPAVTPAAVQAPILKAPIAKASEGRKSGTAALAAKLAAPSPVRPSSAPENPFRWQGRPSATVPRTLTLEELDEAALQAGWPKIEGWWPQMRQIITEFECPSLTTHCYNGADPNGGSYGLAQLNGRDHFDTCGEPFEMRYDPVVNLRVALCVRAALGHFGGPGGWGGADVLGIR